MSAWISNKIIPPMWAQLHTGNPGVRGLDNISLGNVERVMWERGAGLPEWVNVGGVTEHITDVTLWDQPAFGNLLAWTELTEKRRSWGRDRGVTWKKGHKFCLIFDMTVMAA